eukprot:4218765-Pyramimonas_sp.AAC.1
MNLRHRVTSLRTDTDFETGIGHAICIRQTRIAYHRKSGHANDEYGGLDQLVGVLLHSYYLNRVNLVREPFGEGRDKAGAHDRMRWGCVLTPVIVSILRRSRYHLLA